jgi:hypothetical protein
MKRLNTKNIIVLAAVLIAAHLCAGLFLGPVITKALVKVANERTRAKITLESARVWPLTLSASVSGLKVFDPDDTNKRLISIDRLSLRLSPVGLLRKRVVVAAAAVNGADVSLEGTADGGFTIEKVGGKQPEPGTPGAALQKGDWFGKIYERVKDRIFKQRSKKEKAGQPAEKEKEVLEVRQLPKGRRIVFRQRDSYQFEVVSLSAKNVILHLKTAEGDSLEVSPAELNVRHMGFDPANGISIGGLDVSGQLVKDGKKAGEVRMRYSREQTKGEEGMRVVLSAEGVDLSAVRFLYRDSLPVNVERGTLDLKSDVTIAGGTIDSNHTIRLSNHLLSAKIAAGGDDFLPAPVVCAALNERDPFSIEFPLRGDLAKPDFGPFVQALLKQVKPSMKSVGAAVTGILNGKAKDNPDVAKARDVLESLFGK